MTEPAIQDLIERARRGDHAAFGRLVDLYRVPVYRAALAALQSPADAEDVTQEAFVSAYRRLGDFRGDASLKTWLTAIAWRKALDRRRSVRRWLQAPGRRGAAADPGWRLDPAVDEPGHEASLISAELVAHVRRFIRSLPARLRDPLLLAASGDHSYREIADLLRVPVGTVKWRVSEARRVLRAKLERIGYRR